MSLSPLYWPALLKDYETAAQRFFGAPKSKEILLCCMAVAEHETENGRAWPHTSNFGAIQYRSLTKEEHARFDAGTLKAGDTFAPANGKPGGVLHVDSTPRRVWDPIANKWVVRQIHYPVWFVYFGDDRVAGIEYFLKILWRLSDGCLDRAADLDTLCLKMYQHGYYEQTHPGARPVGQRSEPLTRPEQANVADYTGAVYRCWLSISKILSPQPPKK